MLLVSLSKSVQFGHLYRKLHNRNWKNSMKKGWIESSFTALNHSGSFGKNFAKLEIINIDTCAFTSASNITFCGLSERARFLTHIIGNEMLTYLKMYAFWYDTDTSYLSYTLLHYCWPKKCYVYYPHYSNYFLIVHPVFNADNTFIRKMMFLDYRTRHICCIRTS